MGNWVKARLNSLLDSVIGLLFLSSLIGNLATEVFESLSILQNFAIWMAITLVTFFGIRLLTRTELVIDGVSKVNYGKGLGSSWRLKIRNKGRNTARNCMGKLIVLVDEIPQESFAWDRWPVNEKLGWESGEANIKIRAKVTEELEIAHYGGIYGESLQLAYAKGKEFQEQHALKLIPSNILLVVLIDGDNIKPVYATCRLNIHNRIFEVVQTTSKKPNIKLYQQLVPRKERYLTEQA